MSIHAPDQPASVLPILSHWIDGHPVEVAPETTGPVYNPATGEVVARVPPGGAAEVERTVAAARAAFPAWRDAVMGLQIGRRRSSVSSGASDRR